MKANGITAYNYGANGPNLMIELACTAQQALSMDTALIEISTDDGDIVEIFCAYGKTSASQDAITGRTTLYLYRDPEGYAPLIDHIVRENAALRAQVSEQSEQLATQLEAILDLGDMIGGE